MNMFIGTYTAIVTPFKGGEIDEPSLERLVKAQIRGGVDGIVPVGTTGESPTLDFAEHIRVIALAVKFAHGRIKVIAGTGGNSIIKVGTGAAVMTGTNYLRSTAASQINGGSLLLTNNAMFISPAGEFWLRCTWCRCLELSTH